MTIDELLQAACECVQSALSVLDTEDALDCAEVAQAAAQTAQAMILYTATSKGTDINKTPAFWFRVDSGN